MILKPTVYIVDDDAAVRHFLSSLIRSVDLRTEEFASSQEFLVSYQPIQPGCLLLDIRMPGMSGLELQRELHARGITLPVIILTGHGNVQVAVHAMKAGAVDFIEKPFNNELLIDRVQKSVAASLKEHQARVDQNAILTKMKSLTPREHQVLNLVVAGETNRNIAQRLNISVKTVEIHRAGMMEKMQAKSLVDLVKMAVETT
jgi:FixJ family two-component response regulator